MRIYSVMFGSATVPLSLPSLTMRRGPAASFAAGLGLAGSGRHVARFVEIIVFAILLALMALPAPARAQTFTISSVTASPATVQPGQTVTFSATISASQNASTNYPVEFSLVFNGQNVTQKVFYLTLKADAVSVQAYSWTVPAGTGAGTYSMEVAVFNPTWSSALATKSAALTIAAATVGSGPARQRIRCFLGSRWSAARPRLARCSRQRPEPGRAQLPLPISGPGIKRG